MLLTSLLCFHKKSFSCILLVSTIFALFVTSSFFQTNKLPAATGSETTFIVNEDSSKGHITVENRLISVTWKYKYLPEENFNQGGGNIYELYDKRVDPGKNFNLVGIAPGGDGGSAPPQAGRGGLGATKTYYVEGPGQSEQVASSDNAVGAGTLISKSWRVNASGDFEADFTVDVKSRQDRLVYTIRKHWVLTQKGLITLKYNWEYKADGYTNEASYNFDFNRHLSWQSEAWLSHRWEHEDSS